jgi:diguanylate cyclase (GGDEF)-like protein
MRRHTGRLAVVFLDLDRFKEVNDGMGHEAGDQLLIQLGRRLADSVRPSDTVARFGGDEFAILGDDLRSDGDAEQLARRTLSVFAEPITIQDREIFSTASLGVVVVEDPHAAPQDLLRDADAAMYQAKRRGGARFELFEPSMTTQAQSRLELPGTKTEKNVSA